MEQFRSHHLSRQHVKSTLKVDHTKSPRLVWLTLWCLACTMMVLTVGLVGLVDCQEEQLTVESRQAKEQAAAENELEKLKYLEKLEKLDEYWSELGRPRFGRSYYKQQPRLELFAPTRPLASMQMAKPTITGASSPFYELLKARMAQRYNSNESY